MAAIKVNLRLSDTQSLLSEPADGHLCAIRAAKQAMSDYFNTVAVSSWLLRLAARLQTFEASLAG
jgi:hypothetical protein